MSVFVGICIGQLLWDFPPLGDPYSLKVEQELVEFVAWKMARKQAGGAFFTICKALAGQFVTAGTWSRALN